MWSLSRTCSVRGARSPVLLAQMQKSGEVRKVRDKVSNDLQDKSENRSFDPSKYLTRVGGAEYLEVRWRILWLRTLHPDAVIEMEHVKITDDIAIFKATVVLPTGGKATGYGSETARDFRDFVEKASTKALGRALGALGFGTQFTTDFDYGSDAPAGKFPAVDAPVDFAITRGRRIVAPSEVPRGSNSNDQVVTPRQIKFVLAISREAGIDEKQLNEEVQRTYGKPLAELGRRDASALIERLQARRGAVADLNS